MSNYTELSVVGKDESLPFVGGATAHILTDKVMKNLFLQLCYFGLADIILCDGQLRFFRGWSCSCEEFFVQSRIAGVDIRLHRDQPLESE